VNADLSVAPEIAQLALPLMPVPSPAGPPPVREVTGGAATTGRLATALSGLAAAPQRWWDLVRFNPDSPARIAVPAPFEAWLLVIPPGQAADCHCELATLVAGEGGEGSGALRQGRVRVYGSGRGHAHASAGHGYSVSLHAGRLGPARSV
jgi:hypothetical protein